PGSGRLPPRRPEAGGLLTRGGGARGCRTGPPFVSGPGRSRRGPHGHRDRRRGDGQAPSTAGRALTWKAARRGLLSMSWLGDWDTRGPHCPGARYFTFFFVAWSTSSGVSSTMVVVWTAPVALMASDAAAMLAWSGASTRT